MQHAIYLLLTQAEDLELSAERMAAMTNPQPTRVARQLELAADYRKAAEHLQGLQ